MSSDWKCPECGRVFTRKGQRHACGTGNRDQVLRNRPDFVVETYNEIEKFLENLGDIEVVARDRYVLFRSRRVFTDLSIMANAVRVAIHLKDKVDDPLFIKSVDDGKTVTHVAKLKDAGEVPKIHGYLKEAYEFSLS